eukprot:scaffold7210_cov101-Skeletonema_dohrnii-CCMP3373.AAC.1
MESPGATIIPASAKPRRHTCVCGNEECRLLTVCFQSCDDFRGGFMALPTTTGKLLAQLKEHKLKRTLVHLNQYSSNKDNWPCSIDRRDRSTPPEQTGAATTITSSSSSSNNNNDDADMESKFIANHHFHPEILQTMMDQGKSNIDCMPVDLIKELGLIEKGHYTAADLFYGKVPKGMTSPVYVPVPSYKNARDDYKMVATRWRMTKLLKELRQRRRGNSTLAPRGEDNILQPVEKRARVKENPLPGMRTDNLEDVQRAACFFAEEADFYKAELKRMKDEVKLRKAVWRGEEERLERFAKEEMGGLSRMTISSDLFHRQFKNVARNMFGFEDRSKGSTLSSWEMTKNFIKAMWDIDHVEPTMATIFDKGGRRKRLSTFEQCLMALMWFQNLPDYHFLASVFGCPEQVVSKVIKCWAPQFYEVGCNLARLPLTKDFLLKSYPQSYLDLNFSNYVATVVDGTDVLCQTVRKHRSVNVIQRSDKVKHSAFRGITWSLPMGLVHEFTDPFFARASEKAIVRVWTRHGRFRDIPIGWLISGDKGFDQTSGFYPHYNQILHPAFLTGGDKAQFTEKQMDWNRKACEKRYTSEVVFARFKKYGGLGQIMNRKSFHYVHCLWAWAHGMANMYLPLQTPANCDYFPESKYSKKV